jgi:hypothetical protein
MRQENGGMPGLFNSISQPNLATPVSPTPQTPNGNTDVNLEESFDKKNDLSFEDESVLKVEGKISKSTKQFFIKRTYTFSWNLFTKFHGIYFETTTFNNAL